MKVTLMEQGREIRATGSTGRPASGQAAHGHEPDSPRQHQAGEVLRSFRPLAIDVGIPLGTYFLLRDALGASIWLSLALSSAGPALRAAYGILVQREANLLAALMLAVNAAGIGVAFVTGDPRAMIAKDALVGSVIAIAILVSIVARRPLMTAGLKPYLTQDRPERLIAWDRLRERSAAFRRLELLFSGIWGVVLLADCAARLVGAYTLPVPTMAWLGTVFTLGAVGLAVVAGGFAAAPMAGFIEREARCIPIRQQAHEETPDAR